MEANDISIIALQEHRRVHEEEIKYENIDGHLLVTSSAWRNSSQAAVGGVGFIMNRRAEKALCDVTSVTSRILKATLAGNPEFTLVAAYSPTNMRQNHDETERFYESMRDTIDQTPNTTSWLFSVIGMPRSAQAMFDLLMIAAPTRTVAG